jgi:hypothetical protein
VQTKNRSQAKLTTIAVFPRHYFLENVAIRGDNSMLVTVMNKQELWYIPPPDRAYPNRSATRTYLRPTDTGHCRSRAGRFLYLHIEFIHIA